MLLDYKAKHHANVNGEIPQELFSAIRSISGFTERVEAAKKMLYTNVVLAVIMYPGLLNVWQIKRSNKPMTYRSISSTFRLKQPIMKTGLALHKMGRVVQEVQTYRTHWRRNWPWRSWESSELDAIEIVNLKATSHCRPSTYWSVSHSNRVMETRAQ